MQTRFLRDMRAATPVVAPVDETALQPILLPLVCHH